MYNPNQPRDPAGTSTGGQWSSGLGLASLAASANVWAQEVERIATSTARMLGFPVNRLSVTSGGKFLQFGDQFVEVQGEFDPMTKQISIYASSVQPGQNIKGLLAHEIEHARFYEVATAFKNGSERAGEAFAPYEIPDLAKDGGDVSGYTKFFWNNYRAGKGDALTAIDETLAEISRLRIEGTKTPASKQWMSLYGDVLKAYRDLRHRR